MKAITHLTIVLPFLISSPFTHAQGMLDQIRSSQAITIAHFISSARFLVRNDSVLQKLEDLNGKNVVSTKGTTNIKTLERFNAERGLKMKILEAADHAEAFGMMAQKKADAFAMDDVLLFGLRANSAQPEAFQVIGKLMTIEPYAIMLPKGDVAFKKLVDAEMRRICSRILSSIRAIRWRI